MVREAGRSRGGLAPFSRHRFVGRHKAGPFLEAFPTFVAVFHISPDAYWTLTRQEWVTLAAAIPDQLAAAAASRGAQAPATRPRARPGLGRTFDQVRQSAGGRLDAEALAALGLTS